MSGETGKIGGNSSQPVYQEQPDIPADKRVQSGSKQIGKVSSEKQIEDGQSKTPGTKLQERSVVSHKPALSIKSRAEQLNGIMQKLQAYAASPAGYDYQSAKAALVNTLKQVSDSNELLCCNEKKLPDDIVKLVATRYVELRSVDIADQVMSVFSSDPVEQYSEIASLLEVPFSVHSPLQVIARYSPMTSMKNFPGIKAMDALFVENIYRTLSERMNNLPLPEAMKENKNIKNSYNERANDLAILKSR